MSDSVTEYIYHIVRFRLSATGELFNIGVILFSPDKAKRDFRIIDCFKNFEKCLRFDSTLSFVPPSVLSLDLELNELKRQLLDGDILHKSFSDSIFIDRENLLSSKDGLSDTTEALYHGFVTMLKGAEK